MARVIHKTADIETVGQLIQVLQRFLPDMPVRVGGDDTVTVFQVEPVEGESFEDERGRVEITGEDPWAE